MLALPVIPVIFFSMLSVHFSRFYKMKMPFDYIKSKAHTHQLIKKKNSSYIRKMTIELTIKNL